MDKHLNEIKEQIKDENEKLNKLGDGLKDEIKTYKNDIKDNRVDLYDNKPLMQKIIFLLVGISNFLVGYSFYFLLKDNKKKQWQANYFSIGACIGLILFIILAIGNMVLPIVETSIQN